MTREPPRTAEETEAKRQTDAILNAITDAKATKSPTKFNQSPDLSDKPENSGDA